MVLVEDDLGKKSVTSFVFRNFDDLFKAFPDLKRGRKLHSVVEDRLAMLLKDIYPEAYPVPEPGEIPGGRSDLAFYFGSGRYVVFEIFATVSQVAQDLRHLEQSNAQARIAILTDPILDNETIFREYFRKRPRDPFPWVRLSDILVVENEAAAKEQLRQHIEEAFALGEVLSEPTMIDIASRLAYYGLGDAADPSFGVNKLTENLLQELRPLEMRGFEEAWQIEIQPATSSTMFLAIPTTSVKSSANAIFEAAYDLFDVNRWLDHERPGPRYYAYSLFPLVKTKVRTEQREVVAEHKAGVPGQELLYMTLRVNEYGEISCATSYYTVDQFVVEGRCIFRLGGMIHLFWSFLCLVRELQESMGYPGSNHVCIAMINTEGSHLGHFAKGWPNPYKEKYWMPHLDLSVAEVCRNSNIRVCRDIDLSTLERKIEPKIIYDVAEEIARAYNQREARCFDRDTGKLPDNLWPIR